MPQIICSLALYRQVYLVNSKVGVLAAWNYGFSMLWRKSKIVKIIYEYRTLKEEEHTISMATSNSYILKYKRRTWKGDRN